VVAIVAVIVIVAIALSLLLKGVAGYRDRDH
jgi:hypothetical protein